MCVEHFFDRLVNSDFLKRSISLDNFYKLAGREYVYEMKFVQN